MTKVDTNTFLGRDKSYFVREKKTLIMTKVLWNLYHQTSRDFYWQHTCYV